MVYRQLGVLYGASQCMWHREKLSHALNYHVCRYIHVFLCVFAHHFFIHMISCVHICSHIILCVCGPGVKDSKIRCWLYCVLLLLWVSVTGGWLDSLVLDNCTLPRSVVPISVSLWPRLQEPYLGCMSSSSYPVSSPSCPTHPHNAAGGWIK